MIDAVPFALPCPAGCLGKAKLRIACRLTLLSAFLTVCAAAQGFFPLRDVRPGLHGVGRTVFQGNRVEEFQVEILGVLENVAPKQSVILAKLSGGPLAETGVMQGMSGSPVYIDGKLLGAIALGFPFSKEPIAGIQPIEQMIADSKFTVLARRGTTDRLVATHRIPSQQQRSIPVTSNISSPFGNLTEILTPLSLSGFSLNTLRAFASEFRNLGFAPLQGVYAGKLISQEYSGTVVPGSMISVQLLSGDMSMSADGTVTYVNGSRVYAFGHRFIDGGSTELPFARAEIIAVIPSLNTSFKVSTPRQWVGTIVSDRSTAIAGEIGRRAHTIPLTISVQSPATGTHDYQFQAVSDRLLTSFITQTVIFSVIDATERTVGPATLRLQGRVEFDGNMPPLRVRDLFVSDGALAQQVSADAVVPLGFVLGAGFTDLHIKHIGFVLEPLETKHLLRVAQVWTSRREVRPGDSIELTVLLQGENGLEITRNATYKVPIGAPLGTLNFTVSDANGLNFPDFAGLNQSALHTPEQLIQAINSYRASNAAYVRIWRQEPSFAISGPSAGTDLTDPPPSVMLVLADPSASVTSNPALTLTRGSAVAELTLPLDSYVVSGSKTIQVEVKE
jgi:hypothetical protein